MVFERITHLLSNKVPDEQPLALQDISFSPSIEPDNKRARRNRLAALSTHPTPLKKAA